MLRPLIELRAAVLLAVGLAGCSAPRAPRQLSSPPDAEFLLTTPDSTFWVRADAGGIHVRGSPLLLARYSGRFFEVYTADDDYSYEDALLVGQRVYRRDLESGDSTLLLPDTLVPRIARAYARAHPDEQPLDPNEDTNEDPSTSVTAEVDIADIFGPFMSYQYHADVALEHRQPWHTARSGVIDLRSGRPARLADLFGAAGAERANALGRSAYDSMRSMAMRAAADRGASGQRAMIALEHLHFDASSFMLGSVEGRPAVIFDVPASGQDADGNVLELDPLPLPPVPWWDEVRGAVPDSANGTARWKHGRYSVLARYDTTGENAQLALADDARHEWPLAVVGGPVERVDWIDRPAISSAERRALVRAFDDAASYDEDSRLASAAPGAAHRPPSPPTPRVQ